MKKNIFKALLFGVFTIATTSTFVSCKDYDEDISGLQTGLMSANAALSDAKAALENQISDLKAQLETKDAELALAIENAKNAANDAVANEVRERAAAVAALEAKIEAANRTIAELQAALETKASAEDLAALAGKLNALESSLGSRISEAIAAQAAQDAAVYATKAELSQALEELQLQRTALETLQTKLETLGNEVSSIKTQLTEAVGNINTLLSDVDALKAKVAAAEGNIESLKTEMQALSAKVDTFSASINQLNIWIAKQLRGLVFAPKTYYYGIEATYITTNTGKEYTLPSVNNETKNARYSTKDYFTEVLEQSVARLHMNPATAVIDQANVKIAEVVDADYVDTRAAGTVKLSVASVTTANGDMSVSLKADDPNKIKSIKNDEKVTVFAVEYCYGDTTITSDYVALLAKNVSVGYKIAHTKSATSLVPGAPKGSDACTVGNSYGHLMQTINEATSNSHQDACKWNGKIDLNKCVELHSFQDGVEAAQTVNIAQAKFHYVFELTPNVIAGVDHSKFASIDANGVLTPKDGNEKYSSIGKTPLVRVSVVNEAGKVLDYGYILCKIDDNKCNYVKAATIDWSKAGINPKYWFEYQTWEPGAAEIHVNTVTPEDNTDAAPATLPLAIKVANTFLQNHIDSTNGLITVKDKDGDLFSLSVSDVKLLFHPDNNGKTYTANGKTYTLEVANNGFTLNAKRGTVVSEVATLTNAPADDQVITYAQNSVAKELLNIAGRKEPAKEIEVLVGLTFKTECANLPIDVKPFAVRFIRPINVTGSGYVIEDANADVIQRIPLEGLLTYTDWRYEEWKSNYSAYYGLQPVEILGVNDGDNINVNDDVETDMSGTWKPLSSVTTALQIIYHAPTATDGAYLEYTNNQAGVNEFKLRIPVSVTYIWGTVTNTIEVTVKKTH